MVRVYGILGQGLWGKRLRSPRTLTFQHLCHLPNRARDLL
jgi:hypothetical protein